MELWLTLEKLWYYTENYGISIYKEIKNIVITKKLKKNWITVEKIW